MRTIRLGARFRRDLKREMRGPHRTVLTQNFDDIVRSLALDEQPPARMRDHQLIGDSSGCRDCHIRPDLVLIYRKFNQDVLELVRIGSHSELEL